MIFVKFPIIPLMVKEYLNSEEQQTAYHTVVIVFAYANRIYQDGSTSIQTYQMVSSPGILLISVM